jgi:hypothetical protein
MFSTRSIESIELGTFSPVVPFAATAAGPRLLRATRPEREAEAPRESGSWRSAAARLLRLRRPA